MGLRRVGVGEAGSAIPHTIIHIKTHQATQLPQGALTSLCANRTLASCSTRPASLRSTMGCVTRLISKLLLAWLKQRSAIFVLCQPLPCIACSLLLISSILAQLSPHCIPSSTLVPAATDTT